MRKIFLSALLLVVTLTAGAVRPMHKLFPVKQNDGTTVMLYKNGDGHLAFYTTEDNKVVVRDANGRLCYAEMDGNGKLVATAMAVHNMDERTADEQAFVSTLTLKPSDKALLPLLENDTRVLGTVVKKAGRASTADGLGRFGANSSGAVPSNGHLTVPVIMVAFQDKDFQADHDIAKISRYFNEPGYNEDNSYEVGSVKDYFIASSYGHFVPTFDVVAKVTLNHPYSYYGRNSSNGHDTRAYQFVQDAIAAAVAQGVNFNQYRVNGTIPNVTIMYAGQGEATGGGENTIWPHEMDLGSWYGYISGYQFGSYFVGNEMYTDDMIMGIGVFCHEFSHALGLPDFYITDYSYDGDSPLGYWSVMDGGEYTGNSYAPVGYTAYERSFMGWLDVKELTDEQSVTLENPKDSDAAYAVMFRNPSNSSEYFILENRQPDTWYSSQLGSGVLMTRVAYNSNAWQSNNLNNTQSRKRMMVVTADGSNLGATQSLDSYGNSNQLFGNGVNYSDSVIMYNGTTSRDFPIYKIIKHNDGTVTFSFKNQNLDPEVIESNGKTFEKVTDISQLSTGDSVIFVNDEQKVALSTSSQGSHRSAANVVINGNIANGNNDVLIFRVQHSTTNDRWGFRSGNTYLSASASGISLARNTTNALSEISFANGSASVHFVGRNNRYLGYASPETYFTSYTDDPANIQIYRLATGIVDGINSVKAVSKENADNRVFNLNGQFVGTSLTGLQKGIYIQNGKKVVVK